MSITRVDSVTALKALTPATGDLADLQGYYVAGDGGGGQLYWDSSSTLIDNGGTIIQPSSAPSSGRWIRNYSTPIDVRWFGAYGDNSHDDTSKINTALGILTTGEVVFGQNGVYLISGTLTISNGLIVDLNGATVQFAASVATTSVAAFTVNSNNVTIRNGIIKGTYLPGTDVPTPGVGPYGIGVTTTTVKSNLTVDRIFIQYVQAHGINAVNVTNLNITNCQFLNTGYISLYCYNSSTSPVTICGIIDGNVFDRSGLLPAKITQQLVAIRSSASTNPTSKLIFSNNKLIGVPSPSDYSAACMELRYANNATISDNIFINGTLGLSIVGCSSVTASGNVCFGAVKGIELGNGSYNILDGNSIDGNNVTGSQGILLDGDIGSATYNTISNNNVCNVLLNCIEVEKGNNNMNIIGGVLAQPSHASPCIAVIGASNTLISGVMMRGTGSPGGSYGIQLNNGDTGNLTQNTIIDGCVFMDFTSSALNVYAPNGGTITGLRFLNNYTNGTMLSATLAMGAIIQTPYYYGNSPEINGSKIILASGSNSGVGVASPMVAGTISVSNTLVTANSIILLTVSATGGTPGNLSYAKTPGTGFTISSSSSTDTSVVSYLIIN